jgi:hypothetical protein
MEMVIVMDIQFLLLLKMEMKKQQYKKAVKNSLFEAQEDVNNIDYIEEISKEEYEDMSLSSDVRDK